MNIDWKRVCEVVANAAFWKQVYGDAYLFSTELNKEENNHE